MELNAILTLINLLFTADVNARVRYDYDWNELDVVISKVETPHTGM